MLFRPLNEYCEFEAKERDIQYDEAKASFPNPARLGLNMNTIGVSLWYETRNPNSPTWAECSKPNVDSKY